MANAELQLLSNIIRDGDLAGLRRMGFNASLMQTEEAREVFRWLMSAFTDPMSAGNVPSLDRVRRRFPEFDYCPTRDSIEALAKEVTDNNVKSGIRAQIEEMETLLDEGEDPQIVLGAFLPELRDLSMQGGDNRHLSISASAKLLREDYEQMQRAGGITGIPFPWAPLNQTTAGMQPEDFIVLYARPKQMKTWVALAICVTAYLAGYRVLVYSKEMSSRTMMRRAASIIAAVDYERVKTGRLDGEEEETYFEVLAMLESYEKSSTDAKGHRAALHFLSDRDIKGTGSKKGVTVDILSAEAERFGADVILVDGFYLMRDGRTGVKSRDWKQVGNISSDIKEMAQHLGVPVIGTTQANRGASKTVGDDVEEIGYADAIGQDADLTIRVFKAKNPATGKPKLMLTFPGTRDSVMNPFVINAWPGKDFSLLQSTVDVDAFLKDKSASDAEEKGNAPSAEGGQSGQGQRQRPRASSRIRE